VALSFLVLIAAGTVGFRWLPGIQAGPPLPWIDALFMATSAICVTGLSVVDVSRDLTVWGQAWILLLIQAGGLGILTLAGLVVALVRGRPGLALEEATGGAGAVLPPATAARTLRTAVGFTLTLEAAGAAVLWLAWRDDFPPAHAAWLAVFHAVSGFCNAGFSLFSDSLVGFRGETLLLATVGGLVILGGLGFPVIQDLRYRLRGRHRRLTLHTRLVLGATAVVLAVSTGLYLVFEWDHVLAGLGPLERIQNGTFMAVTARTAGFNTVDYDGLSNPSLLLTLALMWIGGGPASIAGGVKVTTAALLALVLWARLAGDRHVSLGGRTIPAETVQRAAGLAAGAMLLLAAFVFALLWTEYPGATDATDRARLVAIVFEAQSALGTVGLSMGITPELTPAGRLLLVPLMLLGRLGPLVVLSAMVVRQRRRPDVRYAHEDVLVG
jgi:trk system potassium uptake protein TrkH